MKSSSSPDFAGGETVLINKPVEWTSFDVVNKVRNVILRKLKLPKIRVGHAGTLDPLASGLLILCTGKATKNIHEFMDMDKEYSGVMCLGGTTASFDLETPVENPTDISHLTEADIMEAVKPFIGETEQVPPIYSALKLEGKRAYRYAREDVMKEIPPRKVNITKFEITAIQGPHVAFEVSCSKGTYIRSLVNDYGHTLKTGAYLLSLTRTRIGPYHLKDAFTIEAFEKWCLSAD
ncbi:MAG: tRNA pseudouridine(55) synthase TruB [Bacteroidales bacterium]|nr:tRNA pseudouridine(55) synthase TruB [Bacteroidales bacterium]